MSIVVKTMTHLLTAWYAHSQAVDSSATDPLPVRLVQLYR